MAIAIGSDQTLIVTITDAAGNLVSNATVSAVLYDPNNNAIATINLNNIGNGEYSGILASTITSTLLDSNIYDIKFTAQANGYTINYNFFQIASTPSSPSSSSSFASSSSCTG